MKKNIFLFIILLVFGFLVSCDDDEGADGFDIDVIPELENGGFIRFPDGETPSVIGLAEENNSTITLNIEDFNDNVASFTLDLEANIASEDSIFSIENFITASSFTPTITVDLAEVANRANIPFSSIGFGDQLSFVATVTTTDGGVFVGTIPTFDAETGTVGDGNTENQLLTNPNSYNSAMAFNLFVACPEVVISDFVGTYDVEFHRFDAFFAPAVATREVVAGPGENQITIVGGAVVQDGPDDLVLNIDPVSGDVSYGGSSEAIHFNTFGPAVYSSVTGLSFSCIGFIDITINSPGFIPNFLTIRKQ